MNQFILFALLFAILWCGLDAALEDFIVGPDSDLEEGDHWQTDCSNENVEDNVLIPFSDVLKDGFVDVELLKRVLNQHAQYFGLNLQQLANLAIADTDTEDEVISDLASCEPNEPDWSTC